jgi:hypothetical protein
MVFPIFVSIDRSELTDERTESPPQFEEPRPRKYIIGSTTNSKSPQMQEDVSGVRRTKRSYFFGGLQVAQELQWLHRDATAVAFGKRLNIDNEDRILYLPLEDFYIPRPTATPYPLATLYL